MPGALTNPAYITLCLIFGVIGYNLAFAKGQLFREGLFQFVTSFSLPLYAIVGAQKGVSVGLPVARRPRALGHRPHGRPLVRRRFQRRAAQAIHPRRVVRDGSRCSPGFIWVLCDTAGFNTWLSAAIAFVIGYTLRVLALYRGWEEPLAKEPAGVYLHDDGRPLLGRKLKGKSKREMEYLGLTTEEQST